MALHRRQRLREVIKPLAVEVMGKQLGVVVEHDHAAPDPQAERQRQRALAGPAQSRLAARRAQRFTVVEVFRAALAAIENGVAQLHQRRPPFAFPHPSVRIAQAIGESAGKQVAQELRVERPVCEGVVVNARHGAVAVIVGIEDEQRFRAVELGHGRQIKASDRGFLFPSSG